MVEAMKTAKSKGRESRKMEYHHTEIHPADNGGHTVEHYEQAAPSVGKGMGDYRPVEKTSTNVFSNAPEMIAHIMDTHGVKPAEMAEHFKGSNEAKPGGNTQAEAVGAQADNEEDEDA
jgi:hypothetical protein